MAAKEESPEPNATPAQAQTSSKPYVSRWHTTGERVEAVKAKMRRRRAAHRIALRRSHSKG
jgi:hypothetical protein